ncbi:MAG: HlyC/CorC family transporter [Ruminococcaceae bacterium]|nr:HlyC/CorC family transporter [Oscillospiraceae bacterium]
MDDSPAGYLISILALLVMAAYFAGAEISLASVNRIRLENRAEDGDKRAKRAIYILDHFDKALTTLLIGTNVTHAGIATLSTVFTYKLFDSIDSMPDYAVTLSTIISTIVVFLIGEMIPKAFAKACNEKFALSIAGSLVFLMNVMTPISFFFSAISEFASRPFKKKAEETPTVTEEELYDIIETFVEENDLDEETEELVQNAIDFSARTAKDVMTPWSKVIHIHEHDSNEKVLECIRRTTYSRLPVVNDDGWVVGTLSIRAFLKCHYKKEDFNVREIMNSATMIDNSTPVDDLLSTLSTNRTHVAYVHAFGKILGIITVEDILEELVGEIYDEKEGGNVND